ncbi:hypothetical protein [Erysipelothrix aquatica]|uniref:hypothetical protein n=1 Tax=Erysipelothrix aquatica TaxID=2683714 RepID=UPI00135847D5|nr:hypothetical protein [Erysipelothrix aquatica]
MKKLVIMIFALVLVTGCTSIEDKVIKEVTKTLFVSDVDINCSDIFPIIVDYAIDVSDPDVLTETSPFIVSGTIKNVEKVDINKEGFIETTYSVELDEIYKGAINTDEIAVIVPGGQMTLGEYIQKLDEMGIYEMVSSTKSDAFLEKKGIKKEDVIDPREQDPNKIITHNFGTNPTSRSFIETKEPEKYVFYLVEHKGVYAALSFDHGMKYIKNGTVYSVIETNEATKPFEETKLR